MPDRRFFEFGPFRLDASGRVLFRNARPVPLPPKAIDTLLVLIENAGDVVEKEDLLEQVWNGAFVEEGSLTRTMSVLRKALCAGRSRDEFIATIPKRGYRFVTNVREVTEPSRSIPSGTKLMLAVLPFENLSGKSSQEYFSDGLTEEMITQLGCLNPSRLGVIARTSAIQYRDTSKTVREIGRELNVAYVLEGSVRRAGGRVRIAAQLIQVSDQTHLWADNFERELGDILNLQSEVARAIARQVQVRLIPEQEERLFARVSVKPEAYEAYLRGRYLWNQRTLQTLENSIRQYERAIQADPTYALAYAGLADSYLTLQDNGHMGTLKATAAAKTAARKALAMDEFLSEPHISLAHAYFHEFNWPAAEKEFQRGIDLNPNYATAHFYYANYLLVMERFDDALAAARRAQALDPVSPATGSNTATVLCYAGRYDESIAQSLLVLDSSPGFANSYEDLGRAYVLNGMHAQSLKAFEKAVELSDRSPRFVASLAHAYAEAGKRKKALSLLRELRSCARHSHVPSYAFALVEAALGNNDEAFAWLDKAYEERSAALPFIKINLRLSGIHSDLRFPRLLDRLALPGSPAVKA